MLAQRFAAPLKLRLEPAHLANFIRSSSVVAFKVFLLVLLWQLSIRLLLLPPISLRLSSRSTLRTLWKVLRLWTHRFYDKHQRLPLLPGLRLSGHCTRARALPHVQKGPWSFCDRGEMAHPR